MPALTVADLSADQLVAYQAVMTWLSGQGPFAAKKTLSLGGFAGSGKSTVVSVLAHELLKLGPLAFCAFTGKASSVLARKLMESGIATASRIASRGRLMAPNPRPYCGTIHGLVYAPCDVCMVEEDHKHTRGPDCDEGDEGGPSGKCLACDPPPPAKKERKGPCPKCNNARFTRRSGLDRGYRLVIVDEASMVDDAMLKDLLSFGVPILAVGDHGQLPPVKGAGSLMKSPDLRLEKIHRQAAGNPIIALSARIRETGAIDWSLVDGDRIRSMDRREFDAYVTDRFQPARLEAKDVMTTTIVTWTNRQRVALNHQVREALGTANLPPKAGEAVICLKNKAPIYNGMRGLVCWDSETVQDSEEDPYKGYKTEIDFVEDGQKTEVKMADAQLFVEKTIDYNTAQEAELSLGRLGDLYDFGYALTCHKMQGSQADEIVVMLDGVKAMDRETLTRWLYTSVTRAAKKLILVT